MTNRVVAMENKLSQTEQYLAEANQHVEQLERELRRALIGLRTVRPCVEVYRDKYDYTVGTLPRFATLRNRLLTDGGQLSVSRSSPPLSWLCMDMGYAASSENMEVCLRGAGVSMKRSVCFMAASMRRQAVPW